MAQVRWAQDAVIYEVYVRSFADSDGDGQGDLAGVASRLDYLVDLGVDAIWLTPFYRSPMADGGYDVADYRDVDPRFGTLADFDKLLVDAHERDLRVIIDIVPNHCSDQHAWFQAALAAGPGSPERELFHFRRGRNALAAGPGGDGGEAPPNNWQSIFRGPAWTRLPDGDWYLHLFAPEQPDLNWDHPVVRAEFADILRFWLDRGVDGVRIDVAHGLVKAPGLPDAPGPGAAILVGDENPYFDQDGVHDIYRSWRSILDAYVPERIAVAEAWVHDVARMARYVRPDELHQSFNFGFLGALWQGSECRRIIDSSLSAMESVGAPTTWVLSNHDVIRQASRLATVAEGSGHGGAGDEVAVGLRRARAAIMLMLALPGSVYLYQGEELGLPEVFDLPADARQDPIFSRTGGKELGRDGCRVPLPWSGTQPPYGFGPDGSTPWLPQPPLWSEMSVAAQQTDPDSTLSLYRTAMQLRRGLFHPQGLTWLSDKDADVLVFERPGRDGRMVRCAVNQSTTAVDLPGRPLLASGPFTGDELPPDTAVWWVVDLA